ncbi:glycoside hydrolase family 18 protein [Phlebopus sp. FC_14]|nr:glycoside hydrolase family 18 protein [Phlebopus sp. FC_14]
MVCIRAILSAVATTFSLVQSAHAASIADKLSRLSPLARNVLKRATPVAPHFVVYNDRYISSPPSPTDIDGFNVFALSFLLSYGAADQALVWQELTASQRTSILNEYNAAGISLVVALFGSTETPTSSGYDPINTANTMAAWVIEYGLQGVDVDYEDFYAFDAGTGAAEQWLGNFTKQLRTQLPQGQYILTHAPVAPWFSPNVWGGGGYLLVNSMVGSMIDWYNVQFYNQGTSEYTTCNGLLYTSSSVWPESSVFQIAANGVSLDKLVIGKPATTADASNGYMSTTDLASCVAEAHAAGWNGGVMVWQYPDAASSWITSVRGDTWPVSPVSTASTTTAQSTTVRTTSTTAIGTKTTTTTTTTSKTTTTRATSSSASSSHSTTTTSATSGTGNCAGIPAWQTGVAYVGGDEVTYDGDLWTAKWWTENDVPGGLAGVWANDGACTSAATAAVQGRMIPPALITPVPAL